MVDDDVGFRIAITGALLAAGECVLTDESVQTALETMANMGDRIGVVLSDLSLPDGSGIDVLDAARNTLPHAARVLMSSSFSQSEKDEGGRWTHVSKLSPLATFPRVVEDMRKYKKNM